MTDLPASEETAYKAAGRALHLWERDRIGTEPDLIDWEAGAEEVVHAYLAVRQDSVVAVVREMRNLVGPASERLVREWAKRLSEEPE